MTDRLMLRSKDLELIIAGDAPRLEDLEFNDGPIYVDGKIPTFGGSSPNTVWYQGGQYKTVTWLCDDDGYAVFEYQELEK